MCSISLFTVARMYKHYWQYKYQHNAMNQKLGSEMKWECHMFFIVLTVISVLMSGIQGPQMIILWRRKLSDVWELKNSALARV